MDCKWAHNGNRRGMLRAFPLPIGGRVFGVFGPRNHNGEGVEEEGSGLLRLRLWVAFFYILSCVSFFSYRPVACTGRGMVARVRSGGRRVSTGSLDKRRLMGRQVRVSHCSGSSAYKGQM